MPDPNPNTPDLSADNVIPSVSVTPDPNAVAATHSALDDLLAKMTPSSNTPTTEEVPPKTEETPPKTEETPPKTDETPPKTEETPPKVETPPKTEEVPPATETDGLPKEEFDKVELPPYSKPATAEQFAKVKTMAKFRIDALVKERDDLSAKLRDVEVKVGKLPAETEQELNELRAFRKQLDVEYDPSFKQFDTSIKQNDESILGKLKEAGIEDEVIKKIREIGVAQVDWDTILPKLPSGIKRFVENKLFANDDLKEQRNRAVDTAKKNADKFLQDRQQATEKQSKAEQAQVQSDFKDLLSKLPWSQRKTVPATATAEEKAGVTAHNKFLDEVDAAIQDASEDNTPHMRAALTLGYVQALQLQRQVSAMTAGLDVQKKAWEGEKAKLQSKIDEQDAFIAKIKKSSSASRMSVVAAPGQVTKAPDNESGADALDRHRSEITAAA